MGKRPVYYVQKSYRNEDGKPSTKYVERLGTLEDLEFSVYTTMEMLSSLADHSNRLITRMRDFAV